MKRRLFGVLTLALLFGTSLPLMAQTGRDREETQQERRTDEKIRPDRPPFSRRDWATPYPRSENFNIFRGSGYRDDRGLGPIYDFRFDDDEWQRSWRDREESPAWFPDGRRIAFASNRESDRLDIYTVDTNDSRSTPRRLTFSSANDYAPSVSPDGRWIAFISDRDGRPALYVMRADGRDQKRLVRPSNDAIGTPSWSPDGRWVAFSSRSGSGSVLFRVAVDGSGRIERIGGYNTR